MGQTVRIKMLGNAFEFTVGQEYDVELERAMTLVGMGYAVQVPEPPKKPATAKE
jgi:hypothetical protein